MLAKIEMNGNVGENFTSALLGKEFWLLKRSVDVDGADFMVQVPAEDIKNLRERHKKIEVFGVVQSKFFEGKNKVDIQKEYVLDEGQPRPEFFAILHTVDENGSFSHYFFTAKQITQVFNLEPHGKNFRFQLTNQREYLEYRNLHPQKIYQQIREGILNTQADRNLRFIKKVYIVEKQIIHRANGQRTYETGSDQYILSEKEGIISKVNKATGTSSVVSVISGNLDGHQFDPDTETVFVDSVSLRSR